MSHRGKTPYEVICEELAFNYAVLFLRNPYLNPGPDLVRNTVLRLPLASFDAGVLS
jgi:hypothetical protein